MRLRPAVPVLPSLLVASRLEPLLLAQPADSRPAALLDEIGAATLVLGTALGGGFLALPHATAPAGCLPATAVLTLCWLFLLLESLLVADLVIDATSEASPGGTPSFDSLGRAAFGDAGGAAVSATFLVLMLTTLVAQIAKASELAGGGAFGAAPRSLRCALLTAPLAVIARCAPPRLLGRLNGALTVGFVASAASLFVRGSQLASWSRLSRADWSVAAAAAPSLLQLHVYCEVVPTVVELLGRDRRPRCSRDVNEVSELWPRCSRDVNEVSELWPRCSRDVNEVSELWPRCSRDVNEVSELWPSCSRGAAEISQKLAHARRGPL